SSSKDDLDETHYEFFRCQDREQERDEGCCSRGSETRDVFEPERDRTHVAHHGIAVPQVRERLNVAGPKQFFVRGETTKNPFLFEAVDVSLSDKAVVGQTFSFCSGQRRRKHQERSENDNNKKGDKSGDLCLE